MAHIIPTHVSLVRAHHMVTPGCKVHWEINLWLDSHFPATNSHYRRQSISLGPPSHLCHAILSSCGKSPWRSHTYPCLTVCLQPRQQHFQSCPWVWLDLQDRLISTWDLRQTSVSFGKTWCGMLQTGQQQVTGQGPKPRPAPRPALSYSVTSDNYEFGKGYACFLPFQLCYNSYSFKRPGYARFSFSTKTLFTVTLTQFLSRTGSRDYVLNEWTNKHW